MVDDEDFEKLIKYKWYAHKHRNTFYAVGSTKKPNPIRIKMHRLIMNTP